MTTHDIVCIHSGEWTALYIDGRLDRVGDSYLADERIHELFDIRDIGEDDGGRFVIPRGASREDIPTKLEDAYAAIEQGKAGLERAQRLREQATQLQAEADKLEGKT